MKPMFALPEIRQAGLGRDEPQYDDRTGILEEVVAVVTAVYPINHPANGLGQTLVDIQCGHLLPAWKRVPLGATHAHGDTEKYVENSRRRQPYDPRPRSQMEGAVYDVRPGTRVLVTFPSGDLRSPVITNLLKYNRQGEGGFPAEKHGVDRWQDGKLLTMVEVNPLDSSLEEYPRAVDTYNGTRIERDNKGNLNLQTTINRESLFPGHNGIPKSPTPEGNVGISTRGAVQGNVGITTGRHPTTGDASDGRIRVETAQARVGNLIARLRSEKGRAWLSTRGSGDGRVFFEDKERDYLALHADGKAELHGEDNVTLDSGLVYLGHTGCSHNVVMWPELDIIMQLLCGIFDAHGHTLVQSGEDISGPPNAGQLHTWTTRGPECRSDVAFTEKSANASPTYEGDPDGESL